VAQAYKPSYLGFRKTMIWSQPGKKSVRSPSTNKGWAAWHVPISLGMLKA
jgi:hypothetical protein